MKILITGGLGFIGHAIARRLLEEGHEVHALGRTSNPPTNKLIHGLHYHSHDLSRERLKDDWFKGTETVFHVAAKAGIGGRYQDYRLANLSATEQLLQACTEMDVSHFIYTSTPSVSFSTRPIRGGDESLPYSSEVFSPYASTKALAEQAVLSAHDSKGLRTLALRPHLVWGPGDPHLLPRVISRHRAGKLKMVGDGQNRVDLTHLDNVVHAHLCALHSMVSDQQLGGKAYFIGQEEPVLLWDWLNEIFAELGLPRLEKSVSYRTAFRLGYLIEGIWAMFSLSGDPPMTRFVASQLAHDHWFSSSAAKKDLGYRPLICMEEAMRKTLPWLKTL
ncbi:MAG: NAD-dependent epimerase/dehydratase family protein [Opitutae bacterium]